jgi:hypothetical protein
MYTVGEQRVRTQFNASASASVDVIKQQAATLINTIDSLRPSQCSSEQARLIALAMTAVEEGAMWGVKAATYGV